MTIASTAPYQVDKAAILNFLKNFALSCVTAFERSEFEGKIRWNVVHEEHRSFVRFNFKDNHHESQYNVYLTKRYYAKDMLRVVSPDTGEEKVMEADTRVFLAYLTF